MYINSTLKCKKIGNMTTVVDNMGIITVEIINKIAKNVISCVYRSLRSCIGTFSDKITELFDRSYNKLVFFM